MSPQEKMLYDKLIDTNQKANQWLAVLYLVVVRFGKDYKLVIEKASEFPIPTLANSIQFDYNKETDTLTLEIIEEKLVKTPNESL